MKQLESAADIHQLVDTFYGKVLQDELLAPFFIRINFAEHLPKMEQFWRFALLSEAGYTTNVTEKHLRMPLEQAHFDRWTTLFNQTVDALFEGDLAEQAKQRAAIIGWTIHSKMNAWAWINNSIFKTKRRGSFFLTTSVYFWIMAKKADIYSKRGIRTGYVSTVIGISLVIFMIGLVLGGIFGLRSIEKQAKENIQADIFFKSALNDADIKQIEEQLKSWPEFSDVFFISPERAIQEFAGESDVEKDVLALFDADNPLPATIGIKPKMDYASQAGMAHIKRKLLSRFKEEIDEVNYDKSSVANVNLGFKQFAILFLAVALLLIIIAVAMINNTIRLALYSKRFTIKTMQLVGATTMYIRKPFLGQALFQGLLSALIGLALLLTVFYGINNLLETIQIAYTIESFLMLISLLFVIGVFITLLSTWFALNKYLRMKLDDLY